MPPAERRAAFIMIGIMAAEAWPMALALENPTQQRLYRRFAAGLGDPLTDIAAIAIAILYCLYSARSLPLIGKRFFEPHPLKLLAIPFALIAGTVEEIYFRKLPMDWALQHGAAWPAQLALTAVLFGLVHGVWGIFGGSWRVALNSVGATAILGAALGVLYLLASRHIAPCIWSHTALTYALEPWLLIAAAEAGASRRRAPAT
jgi:hypothetical protein